MILIFFFISFKCLKSFDYSLNNNKNFTIFCGVDKIKSKVQTYNLTEEQKLNKSKIRKLDLNDENYNPIRIYISTTYLKSQVAQYSGLGITNKTIIILNELKIHLKKLLKVKPLNYTIKVEKQFLSDNGFIDGSGQFDNLLVDPGISCDLIILPKFGTLSDNELSSNNYMNDFYTNRTIIAELLIPLTFGLAQSTAKETYNKIMLFHEITHILGFLYSSFQYFPGGLENTIKSQIDSRGIIRTYIITPTVVKLAKEYYNCSNITGIELENQEEDGHPSSHWEARILLGEYMNSKFYNSEFVLSEFTLALLEDSGWYKINYYTGGLMRFGKKKGCNFINNYCCDSEGITQFKNEYFDLEDKEKPSCSSGRLSRAYNEYNDYKGNDIFYIQSYRTFINNDYNNFGGLTKNADYCFGFSDNVDEGTTNIMVGNCKLGNEAYGSRIKFNDNTYYNNLANQRILGEKFSDNSFCLLSEAFPLGSTADENTNYYNKYNSIIHPICYEMFCTNHSLTIKIKDQYVVCPRKGGKVEVNGDFQGFIYCPDYFLICTGTNMCNNIFDCIKKKSLPKNFIYDYEFNIEKTSSQKISEIQNENIDYGYEINEEGICPENCSQCRDVKRCFKCIEGFKLIGNKDNDTLPIICDKNTNTSIGYYLNNEVYYPCIEFCLECDSSFTCVKCDNIHKTNNDRTECIDKVANCQNYTNTDYTCTKCKGEYAFIGNNRENCYIINEKNKYYTLDEGISYYPCNTTISNCEICNNNKDRCNKCYETYYLVNDNRTFCFNDKNISKYYTEDNGTTYFFCNDSIPFCDTCVEKNICQTCGENHYFIKEDRTHCLTGYDLNKYYSEDNDISYYPCKEAINKCSECDNKYECKKCENDYYLLGNVRNNCRNDFNKNKYYTEDNIVYYLCNTNMEFCDECTSKNTCTKCSNNYGFPGSDRSKCIFVNNNEYYTEDNGISFYPCSTNLLNCQKCLNKTFCSICNQTYHFIGNDRTKCLSITDFDEYYTEDNGFSYFPCYTGVSNCKKCTSKNICTRCQENYYFIGNSNNNLCVNNINIMEYYTLDDGVTYYPCHEAMQNCKYCEEPTNCLGCEDNTYFLRTDTSKCLPLNLKEHYTDDGKLYYPCSDNINNCLECYNKNFCGKCIRNYFLKYEEPTICFDASIFQNDKTYYKLNETHYKKCSSTMSNCIYCNSGVECTLCEDYYYFLNDNLQECVHISRFVPSDEYYKIDEKTYYSCGYEKIVKNCLKCNNPNSCLECKEGYSFQSDLFKNCFSKEEMKIGFYHNEDETMYYPCIPNCDYCVNGEECQQCSLYHELLFDKTICGICQIDFINIDEDLNLDTINSFVKKYLNENENNYSYIPYYINHNKNYSMVIFHSWECTKYLYSMGYFSLNISEITEIIAEKSGDSISSFTYVFVNYGNNQNYIEIYNSDKNLINLKQMCPECLNTDYIITTNLTNAILNSFGKEIINNIVINNINIFNESDLIFSDFCSNFTIQDIDIPLKERRKMLFLGNHANEIICFDLSCEICNISITEFSGSCQCKIQSELSLILQNKTNKQISFDNKGNNNFPIFVCYKEGFDKNTLKTNAGFFIGLILIICQIVAFILYIVFSKTTKKKKLKMEVPASPPSPTSSISQTRKNENSEILFLENFDEIMKGKEKKIINDNENREKDYQDKDELNEDLVSVEDEELENKKTLDYLLSTEDALPQNGKRHNFKLKDYNILKEKNLLLDTHSVNIVTTKQRNEKLIFKDSENESSIKYSKNRSRNKNRELFSKNSGEVNSKSSFESTDKFNIKEIQKKNFSSRIYISLNDAKKYDKTSFFEFYCLILGLRQPIINLCVTNKCIYLGEDYVPLTIKIIRFIFILSLNMFMNILHLNHKYFYRKFEYFDKKYDLKNIELQTKISSSEIFSYAFKNTFLMGFISFLICFLVQELLNRFIINNRVEIDKLINSTIGKVKDEKIKEVLKKPRIKYIILVSINFALMLVFFYCVTNFYAVYRGGIIDYIAASLITFIFIQIFPFILCLIFSLFRYFGIKKSNDKLYKIGQLLIY